MSAIVPARLTLLTSGLATSADRASAGPGPQVKHVAMPDGQALEVTREQMATFLVSAHDLVVERALLGPNDAFTDDDQSVHEANINRAAEAGMALGVSATRFDPGEPVRRNQMASFVVRLAQRLASGSR